MSEQPAQPAAGRKPQHKTLGLTPRGWALTGVVAVGAGLLFILWRKRKSAAAASTSTGTSTATAAELAALENELGNLQSSSTATGTAGGGGSTGGGGTISTSGTGTSTGTTATGTSTAAGTSTATGTVTVPQCAGLSAGSAHNTLVAAGLKPTAAPGQKDTWTVSGTSPGAGTVVPAGSAVTILAAPGVGQAASTTVVPDVVGRTAGDAHNLIVAAGLKPTAAPGQKATWNVTGTTPKGGTTVAYGSSVIIAASAPAAKPKAAATHTST
jgi:hypothetical protein